MRYALSDVEKAVSAWIHRVHCRAFDDDYWGFDDYVDLYGYIALFIVYAVIICLIGFAIG